MCASDNTKTIWLSSNNELAIVRCGLCVLAYPVIYSVSSVCILPWPVWSSPAGPRVVRGYQPMTSHACHPPWAPTAHCKNTKPQSHCQLEYRCWSKLHTGSSPHAVDIKDWSFLLGFHHPSIHPLSPAYPESGRGGSSFSSENTIYYIEYTPTLNTLYSSYR